MNLHGTGVALVTPFKKDLSIDFDAYKKLIGYVSGDVEYLVVQGTTGESPTTSLDEKKQLLDFTIKNNITNLPIVFGIGGNNTSLLLDLFEAIDLNGVDAVLSVSPYYNKPSQSALIRHYSDLADKSPKPIILYNVPGRTASNLSASTTLELANHPNIIGIKEASGNMEQITEIALNKKDDFLLISGDDMLSPPMISLGAVGVISVIANAYPKKYGDLIRYCLRGDFEGIKGDFQFLNRINPLLYKESNPVGVKAVLKEMGIMEAYCRAPLYDASDSLIAEIKSLIKK